MSWNHRVVRKIYKGEAWFAIHEVYYDEDGKPKSITEDAIAVSGESMEGLMQTLEWMKQALGEPILEYADF